MSMNATFQLKWCPNENKVVHRPARPRAPFIGTERYCSMFLHSRMEQGRRDDLWSMFFSMMEMIKSKLPWRCEERRYMEHAKVSNEFLQFFFNLSTISTVSKN